MTSETASTPRCVVFIPPPVTHDKLFDGLIGPEVEDFVVDEVPAYALEGEGEHWFVQVRKSGLNTADVVKVLSKLSKARERDIGVAGQKDKHAVTSQWFSLSTVGTVAPTEWQMPEAITVLQVTKHRNKLRTGHLAGNRFRVRLVGRALKDADALRAAADQLRQAGLPNYYGAQRFGHGLSNLDKALGWLQRQASGGARGSRFVAKWMPSVIQSEIFNRYVAKRLELGTDRLLTGEIVRLSGSSKHFEVDAPDVELPRLISRDILLTGPMIGPKTRGASREALELEQSVVDELGLTPEAIQLLGQHAPGTRRDLLMWPEALTAELQSDGSLVLEFALPAGSYATVLAAEFTHCPFGEERQRKPSASRDGNPSTSDGGSDDDED